MRLRSCLLAPVMVLGLLAACGAPGGGGLFGPRLTVAAVSSSNPFTFVGVAGTFTDYALGFTVANIGHETATGLAFSTVAPTGGVGSTLTVNAGTCTGDLAAGSSCSAEVVLDGPYTGEAEGSFTVTSNGGSVSTTTPVHVDIIVIGP